MFDWWAILLSEIMFEWIRIVEISGIVENILLVFAGGVVTYLGSILLEKRQKGIRKREIALLLTKDIEMQINNIEVIRDDFIKKLKQLYEQSEYDRGKLILFDLANISDFYNGNIFLSLVPELSLLPLDCLEKINRYYKFAEMFCKKFNRYLKAGYITKVLEAWQGSDRVLEVGFDSISCLYKKVLNDNAQADKYRQKKPI